MMAEHNKQILTKLSLNNKIVEMRKYVKRARIHSINKLCKEIKRLKNSQAAEERKAKKLKKAENLVRQVLFMKKINADDVTKFAFVNNKTTTQVLNDANESLEKKALVRLTCHKLIAEQIKRFKQVFYYTSDSLQFLIETLGEKYKNKRSKKRATVLLPSSMVSRVSPKEMVMQNQDEESRFNEAKNNVNSDSIKDLCLISKKSKTGNFSEDSQQAPEITIGKHNSKITTSFIKTKKISFKDEMQKKVKQHDGALSKVEDEEESIESGMESIKIKPELMIADPFFITKDKFEYLSVSMKKSIVSSCNNSNEYHKLGNHHPVNKCMNRGGSKRDNVVYKTAKCKIESKNHNGNMIKSISKNLKSKTSDLKCISSNDTMLPIHPSWEAKRKFRSSLLNSRFEGKKIKFVE